MNDNVSGGLLALSRFLKKNVWDAQPIRNIVLFSCMRGIEIHVLAGIKSSSLADFSISVTFILQINVSI
jgi:hypothetical protein